jgi:signal transduction histidine kinase
MRKLIFLLPVFFLFVMQATAQQKKLDSLIAVSNSYHKEDSTKVMHLARVFREYKTLKQTDKFDLYVDSALLIANKLPSKNPLARVYARLGLTFFSSDRLKAVGYFNKSAEAARIANNKIQEAGAVLSLGALYMDIRDYPKSLELHEKAIALCIEGGVPDDASSCYMNLSTIYFDMGEKAKGMEYNRKALQIFEKTGGSEYGVAIAYAKIAENYLESSDQELKRMGVIPADRFKLASAAIEKGLKAARIAAGNAMISRFYNSTGKIHEMQGNYPQAKKLYQMALDTSVLYRDEDEHGNNLMNMGNFYVHKLNDIPAGLSMLRESLQLARQTERMQSEESVLRYLSEAYEKQKNYDSSLYYFRLAIVVKDSLFNQAKEQEITRRQLKLDFDTRERDYKSAQQLADAKLREQQQEILLRNQQLLLSDKEKTLQRLTFLQEQAELQKQKAAQENLLRQEHVKAEYDKKISDQQISLQKVQLDSNRWLSLGLAVVAVIVFGTAMLIYNSRKKTLKLNRVVSEQKQALEELVGVKDKIFSVVSHDMKGPVNNLIAFSSLLEDGDIEQERLALYLQQIRGTLDHTSSLMENLLNWSASQMQGFTPVIEKVDVSVAVQHALKGVEQAVQKKKIVLQNMVMPGVYIKGDKNMTELIVRNLVNNAVKFSQQGGVLELSAKQGIDTVKLTIKDNGVGMDAGKVRQINSASLLSIESTFGTAKEKGTGLGLMLSKHFADLMGGNISVESTPGSGSRFDVSLPGIA